MRISTLQAYEQAIAQMQQREQDLSDAQLRLSSGKRVMRPSDDPIAAAQGERALARIQRAEVSLRTIEASRNVMTMSEQALSDATGLLHSARESLIAAGNGGYSHEERQGIATRLQHIRDQLLSIANRHDGSGQYLFAGQGARDMPFLDRPLPAGVAFNGTPGHSMLAADEVLPGSVDGFEAWMSAPSGNGAFETAAVRSRGSAWIDAGQVTGLPDDRVARYEIRFPTSERYEIRRVSREGSVLDTRAGDYIAGRPLQIDGMAFTIDGVPAIDDEFSIVPSRPELSVFTALDRAIEGLRQPPGRSLPVSQTVTFGLRDLDAVFERLLAVRGRVGETLHRLDLAEDRASTLKLHAEAERSDAEELEMAQAIVEFQQKQTAYEAVLKSYAQVQKLSLFQYIA